MPVKIVDNSGNTSISNGTIKIGDLENMSDEYVDKVALTPIPPRNVVVKRHSFYFTKAQVDALFNHYQSDPAVDAIEVAIGIQVPGSIVTCDELVKDNSNCLAIIISVANKIAMDPFNQVNDYVLINGYKSGPTFSQVDTCCPGSKPPPPES